MITITLTIPEAVALAQTCDCCVSYAGLKEHREASERLHEQLQAHLGYEPELYDFQTGERFQELP